MTWGQALAYFLREAVKSLRRGWRVSLLAVFTIAVSLFLGGAFALLGYNLGRQLESWKGQARIVVYFEPATSDELLEREGRALREHFWVNHVSVVGREEARRRFESVFPDLTDILDDSDAEPLPPSLEISLTAGARSGREQVIRDRLERIEGVRWIDDDRAWLSRLESLVRVGRSVGMVLGALLLAAAVFTIASVIRLTAYRYREEIAVMRQVGATELIIRCPFYVEGLLQGLAGGIVATFGLRLLYAWLSPDAVEDGLRQAVAANFLPWSSLTLLVLLGGVAGTAGAVLSLPREVFGAEPELD